MTQFSNLTPFLLKLVHFYVQFVSLSPFRSDVDFSLLSAHAASFAEGARARAHVGIPSAHLTPHADIKQIPAVVNYPRNHHRIAFVLSANTSPIRPTSACLAGRGRLSIRHLPVKVAVELCLGS